MEYTVTLHRDSLESPWGFRLQGGSDLKSALMIQRVFSGSPAEGELQRGDVLQSINNINASELSHSAAEKQIKSAGGELQLRIKRTGPNPNLPHTSFENQENQKNMYNQPQQMMGSTQYSYGSPGYGSPGAGYSAPPQGYYQSHEPNNQQHYGWVPASGAQQPGGKKFYQPHNFNRPTPGPLSYKPSKNPYSSTSAAAHLQYNSPLGLYSKKNAQNALSQAVPGDSAAGQTIKLSSYEGGETKGDVIDSPTLRYVLREDQVKAKTGHAPDVSFYKQVREYGPGKVPLKAYKETVDDVAPTSDF